MKITGGPNWQFYVVTMFIALWCTTSASWAMMLWFVAFLLGTTVIGLLLQRYNQRENRRIAKEFPLDPIIQRKYGRTD